MLDDKLNLVRGSLIGGAAGDALGYAVEFDRYSKIIAKYGLTGITEYDLVNGVAEISDDTQMTLFTANGLLMGLTRKCMRGIGSSPEYYVEYAYQDWYDTQMKSYESMMKQDDMTRSNRHTWLSGLPELYSCRAPGNTCLTAIRIMKEGRTPQNDSKGCGGVMRVAPWPLFCACHEVRYGIEEIDVAGNELSDVENISRIGEGWVGEETLAIAVYAVARHIDSFEDVLIAAVNHDGDSDSTGAVAGNIIGAIVGYDAIPDKFRNNLELHDVILSIADDLHQGCIISENDEADTQEKRQWFSRYCEMQPAGFKAQQY